MGRRFTLNGLVYTTHKHALSFDEIERMSGTLGPSVTYKMGNGACGILTRGDVIGISEGLVLNAYSTGNA